MGDHLTALTIAGMAVATYFTRAAGFFIIKRIHVTPRLRAFLEALPGAILISIVAPVVITSGRPEMLASAATIATAWKTKNLPISMAVGILSVFILRRVM